MKKSAPIVTILAGIYRLTGVSGKLQAVARRDQVTGVRNGMARRPRLGRLALSVGVFALALACVATPAQAVETAAFEIVARDGRLFPERLEVPAGVRLRLTLRNEGKAPVEFENLDLRVERVLAPDAAAAVLVQPLKPGTYTFIDDFHADTGKMLLIAK
jgi:hypothetical protein